MGLINILGARAPDYLHIMWNSYLKIARKINTIPKKSKSYRHNTKKIYIPDIVKYTQMVQQIILRYIEKPPEQRKKKEPKINDSQPNNKLQNAEPQA
jgi:hypothetical protein